MEKSMNRFENAKDDQEKEPENAKQSNMLESVLHKNHPHAFRRDNQDVARKTAEKLLALARMSPMTRSRSTLARRAGT